MKTTSIEKRMPNEWTCRHRGSMRASPGFKISWPIRPRRRSRAVFATAASQARTSPLVAFTTCLDETTLLIVFHLSDLHETNAKPCRGNHLPGEQDSRRPRSRSEEHTSE